MDLGRRSRRNQEPARKIGTLGSRMQVASPEYKWHPKTSVEIENYGGPIRTRRHAPGLRNEFYDRSLLSQEPSLPHSTWLYWSEFGSTMGALSRPEGGKMGVFRVGSSKLSREPN
jgi:hypothetical protein